MAVSVEAVSAPWRTRKAACADHGVHERLCSFAKGVARMHRFKILGAVFVAALAMGAVTASAAFAATEFVAETGEAKGTTFTVTSGASTLKDGNVVLTCTSAKNQSGKKSEITSAMTVSTVLVFEGCGGKTGAGETCKIHSPGAANGSIETKLLTGKLGLLGAEKVGILFKPEEGTDFVTLESEAGKDCVVTTEVERSIIGEVTPVNTFSTEGKVTFTETSEKQTFRKFTGEEETNELKAFGSAARLVGTANVTLSKKIKVTP